MDETPGRTGPLEDDGAWPTRTNVAVAAGFGLGSAALIQLAWHSPTLFGLVIIPLAGGYVFVGLASPGPWLRRRPPLGRVLVVVGIGTIVVSALLMAADVLSVWGAASFGGSGPPVRHWPLALAVLGFVAAWKGIAMGRRSDPRQALR